MFAFPFMGNSQMFDSIRVSLTHKPTFYGNLTTRNSFISNSRAQVRGFALGINFNKQFTLALGYNWLISDFEEITETLDTNRLKLRYVSPFVEYSFLEKNNIQVSIPIYLGFGQASLENSLGKKANSSFVMLYEPSMKVTYRFFKYFNVSAGLGIRMILAGNNTLNQNFISPTYTIGAGIFIADIYKDVQKAFD